MLALIDNIFWDFFCAKKRLLVLKKIKIHMEVEPKANKRRTKLLVICLKVCFPVCFSGSVDIGVVFCCYPGGSHI